MPFYIVCFEKQRKCDWDEDYYAECTFFADDCRKACWAAGIICLRMNRQYDKVGASREIQIKYLLRLREGDAARIDIDPAIVADYSRTPISGSVTEIRAEIRRILEMFYPRDADRPRGRSSLLLDFSPWLLSELR